jgi:hypothetical protein
MGQKDPGPLAIASSAAEDLAVVSAYPPGPKRCFSDYVGKVLGICLDFIPRCEPGLVIRWCRFQVWNGFMKAHIVAQCA